MGHSYYRRPPAGASLGSARLLIGLGIFGLILLAGIVIYQLTKDAAPKQTVADTDTKQKEKDKEKEKEKDKEKHKKKPPLDDETTPVKSVDPEVGDWAEYRNLQNGAVKVTEKVTIVAREGANYRIRVELNFEGKPRPAVELLHPTDKPLKEKELPTVGTRNKATTTLLNQGTANVRMNGEPVACQTYHFRETMPATLDGKGELVNESHHWVCPRVPFGGFVRAELNALIFKGKPTIVSVKELVRYSRGGKVVTVEAPPPVPVAGGKLDRTKWVHDRGQFEMVRPGAWDETAPGGARHQFKETARTAQYVDLELVQGNTRVRLYDDRCDVSFRPFTETRTFYRGKWEK